MDYHRTTIQLTQEQLKEIKSLAYRYDKRMAEVIRIAIDTFIDLTKKHK